jgi:hypothetical protein
MIRTLCLTSPFGHNHGQSGSRLPLDELLKIFQNGKFWGRQGGVAQLVEQGTFKPTILGANAFTPPLDPSNSPLLPAQNGSSSLTS